MFMPGNHGNHLIVMNQAVTPKKYYLYEIEISKCKVYRHPGNARPKKKPTASGGRNPNSLIESGGDSAIMLHGGAPVHGVAMD
jgi:hypothetical protein